MIASRLSEKPSNQVLVIEAGGRYDGEIENKEDTHEARIGSAE